LTLGNLFNRHPEQLLKTTLEYAISSLVGWGFIPPAWLNCRQDKNKSTSPASRNFFIFNKL